MRALIVCLAMFALASCQTASLDAKIQKNLPALCSAAAKAHSSFLVIASTGNIRQSTMDKEAAAYRAVLVLCNDPASVTVDTALVKAAEAYVIIAEALREAKRS